MRTSDGELLLSWRSGDRTAGDRLFRRYFEPVMRFFRNKVEDQLDDLVQQTFAACVEAHDRVHGTFRGYLFAVARRVWFDYLRRKYRMAREVDLEATALHDLAPGPSQVVAARREYQLLIDALRRLPLQHQVILEMYFWEEMTTAELADALETPHGTIQTRMRRARELLTIAFDAAAAEQGFVPPRPLAFEEWAHGLRPTLAGSTA